MRTWSFCLLFSDLSVSPFFFSVCVCVSVNQFGRFVFFNQIFLFPLFYVLCLCSRFMFHGYHELCIKYLMDKIIVFLLIAPYLHLLT